MDGELSKNNVERSSRTAIMASGSTLNNDSNSNSSNNQRKIHIRFRINKILESTLSSSSGANGKYREPELADSTRKLKSVEELTSLGSKNDSVNGDLVNDRWNSTGRQFFKSDDDLEKKSVVRPVKKRIVSEIMEETSEKQKANKPPVPEVMNSGRSSEKLNENSSTEGNGKSNKLLFRIRTKTKSINGVVNGGNPNPFTAEDFATKTWNFRPRQPPVSNCNGRRSNLESKLSEKSEEKKKKKLEFSVSLSKAEIEADFLAMTGSKPPRIWKKRGRIVQKQLNLCFPGLRLLSIKPNSYRAPDDELKV